MPANRHYLWPTFPRLAVLEGRTAVILFALGTDRDLQVVTAGDRLHRFQLRSTM